MQVRSSNRSVRLVLPLFALLLFSSTAHAQYFGRNKVQWEKFDFKVMKTQHFDIYHYEENLEVVEDVGRMAERWYTRLSRVFNHEFTRKPLVLYSNSADFQQTTTTPGMIGQGTGGFTDQYQNRVVLPLTGSYPDNDHVIGHELVHVFQYEIAAGASRNRRFQLEQLPLWLIEGMAEYFSKGRVDPLTAMWIRDAALNNKMPTIRQLTTDPRYFPYRYGQALLAYVGARYGDQAVVDIFLASGGVGPELGIERALGVSAKELFADWAASAKSLYTPIVQDRTGTLGTPLLGKKTTRGDLNIAPSVSPDGRWIAFLSTRSLFSIDLYLADATTGKVLTRLVSSDSDPHFDALRFIDSAGAWSPDSKRFAFIVFEEGDNKLAILDVDSRDIVDRIGLQGVEAMSNPAWSPDGRYIAVSGQAHGVSDIYLYDLQAKQVRQVTNDKFSDQQPAFSPDGRTIAFSSDRGAAADVAQLKFDSLEIFTVDLNGGQVRAVPLFENGKHINPQYGPDGSIYFIADPTGISDVYRYANGVITQMTRVPTGVSGITETSPAMSVSLRNGLVAFSVYEKDDHNIYTLPANAAGTAVSAAAGNALPIAALLPPERATARESVTSYLQRPAEGLLPESVRFQETGYQPKLHLTYLGPPTIGVGADRFGYGVGGTVSAYYSDVLGYHNVGFTIQGGESSSTNFLNSIGAELFYLNQRDRFNWGGRASHIPYVSGFTYTDRRVITDENGTPFVADVIGQQRDIVTVDELSALSQYPFTTTRRIEASGGYQRYGFTSELEEHFYVGGQLVDIVTTDLDDPFSFNLFRGAVAYVGDSSIFGFISPIKGTRYRYEVEALTGDLNFQTALADWRKYLLAGRVTFAARGLHFGRYGDDAENPQISPLYVGRSTLVRGYEIGSFDIEECDIPDGTDSNDCPAFDRLIGSKMAVASLEARFPLFGVSEFGLVSGAFLPTEFFVFADGGAAWTEDETPEVKFETDTRERVPVFSAGIGLRILLSYIPLQFYYAKPFQRPEKDWEFGFAIAPGW